jgi:hypothetical protein
MVGTTVKIKYLSDDGNLYAVNCPTWANAIAGNPLSTGTDLPKPVGLRARYRMLRNVATGREKRVKVHSAAAAFYTEAMGTAHAAVDDGTVNGFGDAESAGRIGERFLDR